MPDSTIHETHVAQGNDADHHDHHHHHEHAPFSLPLFIFTVLATLAGLLVILRFAAPNLWVAQFTAPIWKGLIVFAGISLMNCFIEYFFHRYVLHKPAVPFLRRFYRLHTRHHGLTCIFRKPAARGQEILYIENRFPIEEPEQHEASFFPWYTMAVFAALLTPFLIVANHFAPSFPWFFGALAALSSSLILYEVLHAINHWPVEKWLPLLESPRWGGLWRRIYGFHLRHHAVTDCNESVSGFFGLPIADWTFRTCIIPKTVYADGEEWAPGKFISPRPTWFIRILDRMAESAIKRHRAAARSA